MQTDTRFRRAHLKTTIQIGTTLLIAAHIAATGGIGSGCGIVPSPSASASATPSPSSSAAASSSSSSSGSSSGSGSSGGSTAVNIKRLYFGATDGTSQGCWYRDLVAGTTHLVSGTGLGTTAKCNSATRVGTKVIFIAENASGQSQLFAQDLLTGAVSVVTINPSGASSPDSGTYEPRSFRTIGNKAYFLANDGTNGSELWVYNADTGAASIVSNIAAGATGSSAYYLTVIDSRLYFQANDGTNGSEPYVHDPATGTTTQLANIHTTAATGSNPHAFIGVSGKVYFRATSAANGAELYVYNPSDTSVTRLTDLNAGAASGFTGSAIVHLNGALYFRGDNGSTGNELARYDIAPNTVSIAANYTAGAGTSNAEPVAAFNSKLYFWATNGTHGMELISYNPSTFVSTLVLDFDAAATDGFGGLLVALSDRLLLLGSNAAYGKELYSMSTGEVVTRVSDVKANAGDGVVSQNDTYRTYGNGTFFFKGDSAATGEEVYGFDVATQTVTLIAEPRSGAATSDPTHLSYIEYVTP